MSRSFFSTKKHKQQSSVDQQDEDSGVQSPTLLMPHLKAPNQHQPSPLSAVSANPVLSHSVAEAEIPPTPPPQQQQQQQQQQQLTVPPKYGGFAGFAPPTPPPSSSDDCTTIRKSEESESRPIPSLSSSATCSSDYEPGHHKLSSLDQDVEVEHEVQEEEDDVTSVGDTVFPKKLDVVTVETIRSSLERTKSLERRRSRRSTKSAKSEKSEGTTTEIAAKSAQEEEEEDSDDKETIPNPTEVHVHDEDISVDLNKDMPAPKSILKSSTSSEQLSSPSPNNNIANDDNDQNNKQSNNNTTATTIADSTTTTTTTTTLDMINFDVLDSDLNLDFNFEKLPDSLPEEIDQEDMDGAKKELSKIEYQYQPMQYDNKSHKRPHSRSSSHRTSSSSERHTLQPPTNNRTNQFYHPLYQKRISQFVPSHNNNNTSTASASSSSASSIFSRPPPEKKTHANNATVSFSSRIVIYDTYDRSDYDRRAELATCNRLTPILAQQIKEELNNFKMEMDIHADSRIYTHFF
ncbi:hypothetical protein TRICI_004920 [Trichomonascus ciferrii]|uniref:Uncharacterized protein n=1 Tax=Trichomonascus ciferrii TaxID=44093 RepID=A0A642UY04_9ASCO|nr:hypothetical protein TRICI_004920 [Trichomonascus ciferrii]